jgi:predicted membrane channel-forming protein YqfA (hemolysin III family)
VRVVLILAAIAIFARIFDQKWLGALVLIFILGCSVFGVVDCMHDLLFGRSRKPWIRIR